MALIKSLDGDFCQERSLRVHFFQLVFSSEILQGHFGPFCHLLMRSRMAQGMGLKVPEAAIVLKLGRAEIGPPGSLIQALARCTELMVEKKRGYQCN